MELLVLNGNELRAAGLPESKAIGTAIATAAAHFKSGDRKPVLEKIAFVAKSPMVFMEDPIWGALASDLLPAEEELIQLQEAKTYKAYGADFIEEGAKAQMDIAVRLPIAVAGALMPDAHQGYGLPIGGVLATNNAVIPYGVGVDIGCRMCLSIYDIPEEKLYGHEAQFKRELIAHTKFNSGGAFQKKDRTEHAVLDSEVFHMNNLIRNLKDKAWAQLGTSGGGNHFVEWGIIDFEQDDAALNIVAGRYVALLSHSGSRGLGATIAGHYTRVAKSVCKLPQEAANLAYLDLNSEEGQEYWLAMNLAGEYASACHEAIHNKLTKAIGGALLGRVENHHNFAWKEQWNRAEVIVHRKGATPAGKGVLGIIPGSMTAPGFLVRGKGNDDAIASASHGAGRQMSRTKARQAFTREELKRTLKEHGVVLAGGDTDEAPGAYKDIAQVMAAQTELVDTLAKFTPKIVRMADDGSRED